MPWPVHEDLSPVPDTPNRSPVSSVGGGCGGEQGERSSMSPDQASSPGGVTSVDCPPSALSATQLAGTTCLHGSAALSNADDSPLLSGVQCRLETKELWDKFYELGTEMIITKSGRSFSSYLIQTYIKHMHKTQMLHCT